MGAPKGNRFWMARTKHGRDRLFKSPEVLWEACCEYFDWVEDNPLYEAKLVSFKGQSKLEEVPKKRVMTVSALCMFLGITAQTWNTWRKEEDFSEVVTQADEVIRNQKFTGAAADMFNPLIIARDLGLSDKKEVTQKTTVKVDENMTPEEAAQAYQTLMEEPQN